MVLPILFLTTQESGPADGGAAFIVVLVVLIVAGYIAALYGRRKAYESAKAIVSTTVKQHLPSLARKRAQLVRFDAYGKQIIDKWMQEIDYFVTHHVLPRLSPHELRAIKEEDIKALIYMVVENAIRENPAFQSFSDDMTPTEFESFCAEQLRRAGWNARVTMQSRDQGVDVVGEKDGIRVVMQCKLYKRPVGNKAVQEIVAAREYEKANYAIVVTNNRYTQDAEDLAATNKVLLLHYSDLCNIDKIIWSSFLRRNTP